VLLLFYSNPGDDIRGALRDEATRWTAVHVATLPFIGLIGAALFMLTRHLPGVAARISWLAIGPFVLLYGAGEAIKGVAAAPGPARPSASQRPAKARQPPLQAHDDFEHAGSRGGPLVAHAAATGRKRPLRVEGGLRPVA
jgi:hypothetical protein